MNIIFFTTTEKNFNFTLPKTHIITTSMKAIFSLLLGFVAIGFTTLADDPSSNNEYFICHFNSEITKSEIIELKQQGFEIVKKDSTETVVLVTIYRSNACFTNDLKKKMDKLIKVDEFGNRVRVNTSRTEESTPEFIKLFFNFI